MTTIATAHGISTAQPAAFFAAWGDMATWPDWNSDTEWVRLDGPFVLGATGRLKPKGAPSVRFVVERLTDREFVDVSTLWGARLTFSHQIVRTDDGRTELTVEITLTGPFRWLWTKIMGAGLAASAQADVDNLIASVEKKAVEKHAARSDA